VSFDPEDLRIEGNPFRVNPFRVNPFRVNPSPQLWRGGDRG